MSSFPDQIDAGGALLRPMRSTDLPCLTRQLGDPRIARWMAAMRQPFGPAEAEQILALSREPVRRLRVVETGGAMVGCLALCPDVWFWLDPAAQGRGLMSAALQAAIAAQFARPAPPLLATCRTDNAASLSLLARLGFSRMPAIRRMFFAGEGRSQPCHDHVLSSELWLLLHPPVLRAGSITLRPALQKDAAALMQMLPGGGRVGSGPWPRPEALAAFIETHRCRRPGHGLFVALDEARRIVGMALFDADRQDCATLFLTGEDEARHAEALNCLVCQHQRPGAAPQ